MFSKLSIRLGLLLFAILMMMELLLYVGLYVSLVDERVDEVSGQLLARGNTHRDVLEDTYDESTLSHVTVMESASDFIVVITDAEGEIIRQSGPVDSALTATIREADRESAPHAGRVIESGWRKNKYIATDSPITIEGRHYGHVYMFAPTSIIREMLGELGGRFLSVGILSLLLTLLVIPFLTRFITRPLLRMKRVTEQLARGGHPAGLDTGRQDELGDLARSIGKLSKDLDRMKNERNAFLASVAHELRTPMTYIQGYADLAMKPGISGEAREKYSAIIREEAHHLSKLVGQLFELARLDQNDFAVRLSPVKLSALADSVLSLVRPAFEEKGVQLLCNIPERLVVRLDATRFQQVLLNLLDNALKHTPAGKQVHLQATVLKDTVKVEVADEGEGIPEDELSTVFDRFYRVDKSRSRKSGGTGLGLAIVKEIIEAHGGQIEARRRPAGGTVMTILLDKGGDDGTHSSGG
ncbi:sensor histidine kinase [Bhargavaea beijingensis]|uniref:histidine kinase n=1 Tax=Bhargavaea beijingensis TaxID=426756 RepID=A0ABX9ZF80_9BACL|nr:HAMP domain-containing sensor histidine kinase [Bhargavaea beijingensis]MCW1927540.1 HAMP domain-containing histidine kinase [Bhargavaea beijingensis]RSK34908.1 sensor histidine kinase [Bhargavaea beijingensis]